MVSRRSLVPPYAKWIAAALGSLALLAAGIVILIPAGDGTIRIEIDDSSIEVTVAATGYTIKGKTEEIHIKPGEHTLHVKTGDLEFDTTKFTLGKGENPAVKVELLAEKVQVVAAGGKVLGEKARPKAQIHTAEAMEKSTFALEFDGVNDHQVRIAKLIDDGKGPITYEVWLQPAQLKDSLGSVIGTGNNSSGARLQIFRNAVRFFTHHDEDKHSSATAPIGAVGSSLTHVAAVRDGRILRIYLNGKLSSGETKTSDDQIKGRSASPIVIGHTGGGTHFAGMIDGVRISKIARYSAEFVPERRFTSDSDTLALYHFDEGQGDVLKDSSGNNHHGKIVGAKWVNAADPSTSSSLPNPKSPIPNQKSAAP